MSDVPPVSLILPNRNNEPVLDVMLERLAANTTYPDFELIVVDDGSTDSSREILRRWRDEGRFRSFQLLETAHSGVSSSLNQGLARASGELVVSLDGDATIETSGWLERMVSLLRSDRRVGVVTGGVVFDTGRIQAYGVTMIDPLGLHDRPSRPREPAGARTWAGDVVRERPPAVSEPAEVDACPGCCMLVPRRLLDELGGWDEGYWPVWFEDLDLALGARRLGTKVFVLPEVHVLHRLSMRNARYEASPMRRVSAGARRMVARALPARALDVAVRTARLDRPTAEQVERVERHHVRWRQKWGFDPLNPDMDEVLRRYGDTEVCWRYDDARRSAGERILRSWATDNDAPSYGSATLP